MFLKTKEESDCMREGGRVLAVILAQLAQSAAPGVKLRDLENQARSMMHEAGVKPAFLGYHGYRAALCVSINDEVVHAPATRDVALVEGDVVSLDTGIEHKGLIVDAAVTVLCGESSAERRVKEKLISTARTALNVGIEQVRDGAYTGDIGFAIQHYVEKKGFAVVRDLVGHGVGKNVHEPPQVPNFGQKGTGDVLRTGMTICIEPMITAGSWHIRTLDDGWTVVTVDHSLAAHFEHTILVTEKGGEILTK